MSEKNEFSIRLTPTVLDYQGVKFGYGIGVDYKHWASIEWFTVRDYNFESNFMDNKYSGLHLNLSHPLSKSFDFVLGMRMGKMSQGSNITTLQDRFVNYHPVATAEVRIKLDPKFNIGLEYGKLKDLGSLTSLNFHFVFP